MKKTTFLACALMSCAAFAQSKRDTHFFKPDPNEKIRVENAENLIKNQLYLTNKDDLILAKSEQDALGFTHQVYQQYFNGIPVAFGLYRVHAKNGMVRSMNGNLYSVGKVNTTPVLSATTALDKAIQFIGAEKYLWQDEEQAALMDNYSKPTGELVVLPKEIFKGETAVLAYKFDVYAMKPVSRAYVYVDAHTGKVVYQDQIIKHFNDVHRNTRKEAAASKNIAEDFYFVTGTAATRYSGTQAIETQYSGSSYRLRETTRGNGIQTYDMNMGINYNNAVDFTDNDNNWTAAEFNNANKDNAALDAHWGAEMTYDYFDQTYNRNSYDNNGAVIRSYVHFDLVEYGYGNQDNAFWNGSVMTYGDGTSFDPLTSLDIAAHEIGHAVCEHTANLTYSYESGAMNEGFSDIWAACVEYFADPTKDTWLLAEEIGGPIRSLSNPKSYGQPDTYQGTYWYTGSGDNGGVHYNSGVLNHWFYILSVGANSSNDNGDSYNVSGIGISDAAAIAYRLESVYLSSGSDYEDARTYGIEAAEDLFGAGSPEVIATTNAFYAVGIGDAYVQTCNLSAPASLASSNISDTGFGISWNSVSGASGYTVTIGASAITVSGTSYSASNLLAGTTYSVTVAANCAGGPSSNVSSINVTTTGTAPVSYCTSQSSNVNDEYISNVALAGIDNPSGAQYYSDFTSVSTSLSANTSYTIVVTPTWTGTVYNEGYAVWIDYNQDGDFSDSGELVWSRSATSTSPVSGSFTVPSAALTGATRMRVAMKYNGIPSACESFTYGEVEDYTVIIGGSTADTQAPSAPTSLAASATTQTSTQLSWTASTDNVGVTGYDVYRNGSLATSITGTSTTITGLSSATTYSFYVIAKDAAGNNSSASNTIQITTDSPSTVTYCSSQGNNSSYEWIDLVQLNGMTNTTGNDGGYADYTSLTANLPYGSNTIYISAGFSSSSYTEYWKVWIDYDKDGNFESNELVVSGSSRSSATLNGTFTVPTTATAGPTRMRVSMKYNSSQTACETFSYGEVEDYTVNIGASGLASFGITEITATELGFENSEAFGISLYPNPVKGNQLYITTAKDREVTYAVYDLLGKQIAHGNLYNNVISVGKLSSGVYLLTLNDGQKTVTKKFVKE